MNNMFSFNRFGKLLAMDGRKYFRNFGITLAILCGLNIVLWILTVLFGFTMPTLARYLVIWLSVFLGMIMVPAKAFGDINLPCEGVRYAMLPASTLEKYFSYILFCLMTPLIIIFGSWGIDSLLTLLPIGGFVHYIRHFVFSDIMQDFFRKMAEMAGADATGKEVFDQEFYNIFDSMHYTYKMIMGLFLNLGIFMFGNLLFKTHKTGKTLVLMIGVSYVVSTIMQMVLIAKGGSFMMNTEVTDFTSLGQLISPIFSIKNIIDTLITIALYVGIFFKFKTQKY